MEAHRTRRRRGNRQPVPRVTLPRLDLGIRPPAKRTFARWRERTGFVRTGRARCRFGSTRTAGELEPRGDEPEARDRRFPRCPPRQSLLRPYLRQGRQPGSGPCGAAPSLADAKARFRMAPDPGRARRALASLRVRPFPEVGPGPPNTARHEAVERGLSTFPDPVEASCRTTTFSRARPSAAGQPDSSRP